MEQITHLSSGIPGVRLIDAEHNRFSFPRHFHLEYHIGLLLQGRHRYAAGGERRLAGAGDALLMAPESIHDAAAPARRATVSASWRSMPTGWSAPAATSATAAGGRRA